MGLFKPNVEKMEKNKDVNGLIKALKDKDVRAGAVVALGKIGKPAVEPLIQALKDKESSVRSGAAAALGGTGDARAVEPLIQALKDKDLTVHDAAYPALVRIGKPAVEPLIQALKDKGGGVRWEAAEALGEIGDARAVEPLIQALKDEMWDFQLRAIAKEALEKLKGKET